MGVILPALIFLAGLFIIPAVVDKTNTYGTRWLCAIYVVVFWVAAVVMLVSPAS